MLEKLPILQKFLGFISKNAMALVVFLLLISIYFNVYLGKELKKALQENIDDGKKSVEFERKRAESYENIVKELIKPTHPNNEKDTLH